MNSTKDLSGLLKKIHSQGGHEINTFKKADGSYTKHGKETLEEIITAHFPGHTATMKERYNNDRQINTTELHGKYCQWINFNKLVLSLQKFKANKSPGPDELRPIAIQKLPNNII